MEEQSRNDIPLFNSSGMKDLIKVKNNVHIFVGQQFKI